MSSRRGSAEDLPGVCCILAIERLTGSEVEILILRGRGYVRYAPTEANTFGGISGGMPRNVILKILLFSMVCVQDGNDTLR